MSSRREKLLQRINPRFLEAIPKLSVDKDSVVDLDLGKDTLKKGAKDLMLRFFRSQEVFFKSISTKDGIELTDASHLESYRFCQSISERLSLPFSSKNEFQLDRPGKKLQDLKKKLEEKMSAKRKEEYQKRVSEYNKWKNEQKEKQCEEEVVDELEEEFSESEKETDDENSGNEEDERSNNETVNNVKNDCDDNSNVQSCEAIESNENNENSNACDKDNNVVNSNALDEEGSSDSDASSLIPPYQAGGEMNFSASEQTQCTQGLPSDLLTPSLGLTLNGSQSLKNFNDNSFQESLAEKKNYSCPDRSKLFSNSQNSNSSYDLADAFEFCSGKFLDNAELQMPTQSDNENVFNDCIDEDFSIKESDEKSERNYDCEKNERTSSSKRKKRIIEFEDSDEEGDCFLEEGKEEESQASNRILPDEDDDSNENLKCKTRGGRRNLNFSDEEDDRDEEANSATEEEEDNDRRSVQYDSEENEIINPREFFEREAELSGSEWSGDEDERGLDEFDEEAGDGDELDYDRIQSQLGKIHLCDSND